ncbi:hypothetical protein ACCS61_14770 [Rhizobium ruizarguesonis]
MSDFDLLDMRWKWSTAPSTIERLRSLADDLEAVTDGWVAERATTVLASWSYATRATPCLIGNTFGHPKIEDGRRAFTSDVYYVDPSRRLARTLSRWYKLGSYEPLEAVTAYRPSETIRVTV